MTKHLTTTATLPAPIDCPNCQAERAKAGRATAFCEAHKQEFIKANITIGKILAKASRIIR